MVQHFFNSTDNDLEKQAIHLVYIKVYDVLQAIGMRSFKAATLAVTLELSTAKVYVETAAVKIEDSQI